MAKHFNLKDLVAPRTTSPESKPPAAPAKPVVAASSASAGAPAAQAPAQPKPAAAPHRPAQAPSQPNGPSHGQKPHHAQAKAGQGEAPSMETILRELGVKASHVRIAVQRAQDTGETLPQIMRDFGFLSGEQVAEAVSRQTGFTYFPSESVDGIERSSLHGIEMPEFRRFVPVGRDPDGKLLVAVPDDRTINDASNTYFDIKTRIVIASEHTIQTVYRKYFANTEKQFDDAIKRFMDSVQAMRRKDEDEASMGLVRDIFFALLRHACYSGASDLYLYKSHYVGIVKLKINGVGTLFRTIDSELYDRLLNKLVQENTKAEDLRREPKESVVEFSDDDKKLHEDIVTRFGFRLELAESRGVRTAVIRLLDKNSNATELSKLGFDAHTFKAINRISQTSTGFFLVTGPTGSGKTTSLYAILKSIDPVERSIQSIENPIEYSHGLWQQYELRKDSTNEGDEYNKWLKALLRNAPDVILVGEVRDREVANICLSAANTGHLVFATLHTNNAVLALARLKGLNLDLDVLGSVLLGILAQRLVRTLCTDCRVVDDSKETKKNLDEAQYLGSVVKTPHKAGAGCENCDYTGYRGRRMVYELLEMNPKVREAIEKNAPPSQIASVGMKPETTMWANGLRMVAAGATSLEALLTAVNRDSA
jgi:type II secretory ATPase GspE/PulE/Tfp pilus assembly ATPase PilB-like protein